MRLNGRVALVTGSSRGIGSAIAMKLATEGACVIVHGRNTAAGMAVVDRIRAAGGTAAAIVGDLAETDGPVQVVREAFAIHGALDIVVWNAGGGSGGKVVDLDPGKVDVALALNIRATMLGTAEYARLTQSPHGRVIFISSGAAVHPSFAASITAAAKAGAEAFIRSAAQELGERGITCNSIAPGTTMTDRIAGQAWVEKLPQWTALKRVGTPEDIAEVAAFVASDEARWITGATIPANGGTLTAASNLIALG